MTTFTLPVTVFLRGINGVDYIKYQKTMLEIIHNNNDQLRRLLFHLSTDRCHFVCGALNID